MNFRLCFDTVSIFICTLTKVSQVRGSLATEIANVAFQ